MNRDSVNDSVSDEEILYRAVAADRRFIAADGQGQPRISSTAFNDANRRPSVDRAILCPGGPQESQARFREGSGILSLAVRDVRSLTTQHGGTGQVYGVDVEPVPLNENPAHAEIFGRPPFDSDKVFERIKQALSRLAVMTLPPNFDLVAEKEDKS